MRRSPPLEHFRKFGAATARQAGRYLPRPPDEADPCPTDELPAEDAALDPELAAAGALDETDGEDDIVPEYPPELLPIVL